MGNEKKNLKNLEYLKDVKLLNLILYPINNNNNILLDNELIFTQIISDKLNNSNWSANEANFDYIFTDYDKEFRNDIFNYIFEKMNPCHFKKNNQENENIFNILKKKKM